MEPIYAHGLHIWTGTHVHLVIIFDYRDRKGEYYEVVRRGGQMLVDELRTLSENMQRFLDEEIIRINGRRVRPLVVDVSVGVKGGPHRPYIEYIVTFEAPISSGVNTYEVYYDEEEAEYDYEIVHLFPPGTRVVDWEMAGTGNAEGNVLRVHVKRGTRVGGREAIRFKVP